MTTHPIHINCIKQLIDTDYWRFQQDHHHYGSISDDDSRQWGVASITATIPGGPYAQQIEISYQEAYTYDIDDPAGSLETNTDDLDYIWSITLHGLYIADDDGNQIEDGMTQIKTYLWQHQSKFSDQIDYSKILPEACTA